MSEKKNGKMKEYYSNNKDKMKEWFKIYYQNNKEKRLKKVETITGITKKQNHIEHNFETVLKRKRNYNKKQKIVNAVNPNEEADKPDKIVVSFG